MGVAEVYLGAEEVEEWVGLRLVEQGQAEVWVELLGEGNWGQVLCLH